MIFFQIEAATLEELRIAACLALNLERPGIPSGVIPQPEFPVTMPGDTITSPEPVKIRKSRKAAPEPQPEPEEPYEVEMPDTITNNGGPDHETIDGTPLTPTGVKEVLANEALKKDTIAQLGALFAAGKVKVVRSALDKYGQGAKSFPEIDASQFPAIAAAIARGDIA